MTREHRRGQLDDLRDLNLLQLENLGDPEISTRIDAYDPKTGDLLCWAGENHRFAVPVPTFHDGVLYTSRG